MKALKNKIINGLTLDEIAEQWANLIVASIKHNNTKSESKRKFCLKNRQSCPNGKDNLS